MGVAAMPKGRVVGQRMEEMVNCSKPQDNPIFKADELIAGKNTENRPAPQ